MPSTSGPSAGRIWSALVTVYFFWGTTYFAIDRSNQTIPSLVGPAIRFTVAGLVLMAWSRMRGGWRPPTGAQWRTAVVVGALLMFGGNGSVAIAEDLGVDTGIVALVFALVPIWLTSIDRIVLRSAPLGWRLAVGLLGGFAGASLLLGGQAAANVTVAGLAMAVGASLSWSIGSLYQRNAPVAQDPFQASGMQQLAGGSVTAIVALAVGQFGRLDVATVSTESGLALLYLIVFGSLITLSAYLWLLRVARTSLVATYAYVNPVVAVTIGWLLNDETITMQTIVAATVILASVALIVSAGGTQRRGRDGPGDGPRDGPASDAGEQGRPKAEAEIGFEG